MGRYVSIFFMTVFVAVALFFTIPALFSAGSSDIDLLVFIGMILIILVSFVITQLFYIMDVLKKRK
ncbi:hypothetical protein [Bacillus sp. MRMR6]|uniref:hypothetical protein n=1 Tax=Bacillus sp. MRMR6 TaxID=1928617 RepID=UPI0009515C58|nr:hypothetical protein [Bacillus sp. MRMR6]OLS40618.1 hypothetical protein BTR25_08955 [Bacillus sp. MRMR6]